MGTVTEKGRQVEKNSIHNGQANAMPPTSKKPGRISAILYRLPLPVAKVLVLLRGDSYPICPRCNCTVDREYMRFCDRCGQHLDWALFDYAKVVHAPYKPK